MVAETFCNKNRRGVWVPAFAGTTTERQLPWRHADGAVETDGLAVEHRVLDDVNREVAILGSIAEAGRMRHLRAEALAGLFVEAHQQRRQEQAGRDGIDADLQATGAARRRQSEADNAGLQRRI